MGGRAVLARWASVWLLALSVAATPARAQSGPGPISPAVPGGPTSPGAGADLAISLAGFRDVIPEPPAHPSDPPSGLPFRVTVTNRGPEDAVGVRVALTVAPGGYGLAAPSRVGSVRASRGDCVVSAPGPVADIVDDRVDCGPFPLASGASATIDFTRTLSDQQPYWTSVAVVSAVSSDPLWQNNRAALSTTLLDCNDTRCTLIGLGCLLLGYYPTRVASQATDLPFDLPLFYRLRDEVVRPGPAGQRYLALYETHSPEIVRLMVADPALRDAVASGLAAWQPSLQALVDGRGDAVVVTAEQVATIERVLDRLSAAGSPALRQAIADERARQPLGQFVGLTVEQARARQVGHRGYLPLGARTGRA